MPSETLGKGFAECFLGFAMCRGHTANLGIPVVSWENLIFFNVFEEEDLDDTNVGYLCGEMLEDFVDDNSDHLSCDFKTVFKKNKSPSMSRPKRKPKVRVVKKVKKFLDERNILE